MRKDRPYVVILTAEIRKARGRRIVRLFQIEKSMKSEDDAASSSVTF